jgi:hypothetical protein
VFWADVNPVRCETVGERLTRQLAVSASPIAVVLAVGGSDHAATRNRLGIVGDTPTDAQVSVLSEVVRQARVVDDVRAQLSSSMPLMVFDPEGGDAIATQLQIATVRNHDAAFVGASQLTDAVARATKAAGDGEHRLRVMVIGDSTSYGVALELDHQAPDSLNVMWAGFRNCPMLPVTDVRWGAGLQFTMDECVAAQSRWPAVAADLHPDVLLLVESLPEHSDQKYPGDPTWHSPSDSVYLAAHDTAMQHLVDMVAPYGTRIYIGDAAPTPIASASRVAEWNRMIDGWASRWSNVVVVQQKATIERMEASAGHSLRPDSMHLDDASEAAMVREVWLPVMLHAVADRSTTAVTG